MHDTVVAMRATRRSGSANTKTKADVNLSRRQAVAAKRHRPGSRRLQVVRRLGGGGVVFGPKPRDYTKKISKTTRRLAFQKALSERIKAGDVLTVDSFAVKEPKTKAFVNLLTEHTDAKKVLIISDAFDENTYRAARNVKPVLLVTAADVNTEQLLAFDKIVVTDNALAQLAERTLSIRNERTITTSFKTFS